MLRNLLFALLIATPVSADTVTVFAAASLKTALDQIATDWQAETGNTVVVSYGGSSALAKQIQQGAPADLFISAATNWMDVLEGDGLLIGGSRLDLLGNSLVVVASGTQPPISVGDLPAQLGTGKLAMAQVDSVPAGQYGKEALTTLGLWDAVAPFVVQAADVRAALALVSTGEAPFGIVYGSDAIAAGDAVSVVATFPTDSHAPITYPAALLTDTAAATAFLDALSGERASAVFTAQGFTPLK